MSRWMRGHSRESRDSAQSDFGFTLVELMVTVLIIGILVAIAIPVFASITQKARYRTCMANQRSIVGAISMWRVDATTPVATLQGVLNISNPLMNPVYLLRPPRCPSAPNAVDQLNPTTAEGAYSIDTSGNVLPCGFGSPVHGGLY
jgi:prepilin-type N-terminal cleavage/methylation domain-containing protein